MHIHKTLLKQTASNTIYILIAETNAELVCKGPIKCMCMNLSLLHITMTITIYICNLLFSY